MPAVTQIARRGLQRGFFPGARGTWSLPSFPSENDGAGSTPLPYLRPITIIVDCIHNILMQENQDEISSPGRFFPHFVENLCRKIQRWVESKGATKAEHSPDAYRWNGPAPAGDSIRRQESPSADGTCFIRSEPAFPPGVRGISIFSPLFLDSPKQTPYLVSVILLDHKIRYH
jgi:hypothetical protein